MVSSLFVSSENSFALGTLAALLVGGGAKYFLHDLQELDESSLFSIHAVGGQEAEPLPETGNVGLGLR